jgi:hypothetical protein
VHYALAGVTGAGSAGRLLVIVAVLAGGVRGMAVNPATLVTDIPVC